MKLVEFAEFVDRHIDGALYKVGGCVRDNVMELPSKDIDCELFCVEPKVFEVFLDNMNIKFDIDHQAKFPVYRITLEEGEVEIGFPRKDNKIGHKHNDFDVVIDPFMTRIDAAKRRDFTINALYEEVITGDIYDPTRFGLDDIEDNVIRPVDEKTFKEDPLRLFRAFQFIARFGFDYHQPVLRVIDEDFLNETKHLSKDSIFKEFEKAIIHGKYFSRALDFLKESGLLRIHFPELDALSECQQSKTHHQEGDVWTHTKMVVEEAMKSFIK
jgi:tRNA nucleotidyltransferase (CCA-adding enzyme)